MRATRFYTVMAVAILLFTACKKEDPAANVYLRTMVVTEGTLKQSMDCVWENNLLKETNMAIEIMPGLTITQTRKYEYEGENVVHIVSDGNPSIPIHYYYAYEGNRLKHYWDADFSLVSWVTEYDAKGNIAKKVDTSFDYVFQYSYQWKDGNVVSITRHKESLDGTIVSDTILTYTYGDKISPFSHFPITDALESEHFMAWRGSKCNLLSDDMDYEYKNGRVVKEKSKNGSYSISYYYTDGVGPDEE